MSRTLHLFGTDWCAMMVPIQVIRWYRMQCYDGTDSCAIVVPIRRYCQPGVVDSPIYCWDSISGSVTIVSITENEIILKFNNFVVHYSNKNVTHTIDGTVGLTLDPEHLN